MEAAKSENYVAQHWRGDLSLFQSFWVTGFVFGLPVKVLAKIASEIAWAPPETVSLGWYLAAGLGLFFALVFYVWSEVGIWRASLKYSGWSIWSFGARLLTVLGLIVALGQYQTDKEKAAAGRNPFTAIVDEEFRAAPTAPAAPRF